MLFLTLWQSIYYPFFSNFKYRHPSVSCLQRPLHPLEVLYIPTFTLYAVIPKHIFLVFKSPGLQKLHCLDIYTWSVVTSHTKYLKSQESFSILPNPLPSATHSLYRFQFKAPSVTFDNFSSFTYSVKGMSILLMSPPSSNLSPPFLFLLPIPKVKAHTSYWECSNACRWSSCPPPTPHPFHPLFIAQVFLKLWPDYAITLFKNFHWVFTAS